MNVFLFSGQGSQCINMGQELLKEDPSLREIYKIGKEICEFDLIDAISNSDEKTLSKTEISQPTIFAVSISAFYTALKFNIEFKAVGGHSLGEYAAMVASGMVSLKDGFKLIYHRSKAMKAAASKNPGSMYAILTENVDLIKDLCSSANGYVLPVNFNSPTQTVIAGEVGPVDSVVSKLENLSIKAIKLPVSSGFHSNLMAEAALEFENKIKDIKFANPKVDFYSNLTGEILNEFSNIPKYLSKHMISPVKFTDELTKIKEAGILNFIELGPNKIITSFVKKTLKGVKATNIEDIKSLQKTISSLSN